jgi:hypothetical protein
MTTFQHAGLAATAGEALTAKAERPTAARARIVLRGLVMKEAPWSFGAFFESLLAATSTSLTIESPGRG